MHLPCLERMSAHWGMQIPAQSMVGWVRIAAGWLSPIYNKMREGLPDCGYLQIDETPVRCNDPCKKNKGKNKGTAKTYLWVMGTPGGDVVFTHKPSRAHEHAARRCWAKTTKASCNPTRIHVIKTTRAGMPG